jgi:hypothetical protein
VQVSDGCMLVRLYHLSLGLCFLILGVLTNWSRLHDQEERATKGLILAYIHQIIHTCSEMSNSCYSYFLGLMPV